MGFLDKIAGKAKDALDDGVADKVLDVIDDKVDDVQIRFRLTREMIF